MSIQLESLTRRLQHEYRNPELLKTALSHRSAGRGNYERLEFLGDSLLNLVVSEHLYHAHPNEDEGALTRLRATLVREETLAEIATELELGQCLNMGTGERRSGGHKRPSILADVVESLIASVYLDSDFDTTRALVLRLMGQRFEQLPPAESLKDPKTRLQELLQSRGLERPVYEIVESGGEAHAPHFRIRCTLPSHGLAVEKTASSRRAAEQQAAAEILDHQAEWLKDEAS